MLKNADSEKEILSSKCWAVRYNQHEQWILDDEYGFCDNNVTKCGIYFQKDRNSLFE